MSESDRNLAIIDKNGIKIIQFNNLLKYEDDVVHCFTTRLGGVSTGECSSLNLGFNRKDSHSNVEANFTRLCDALNIEAKNLVFSNQVHDCRIYAADSDDRGKGIFKESDIKGYDGLMTDKAGVALVTFYADCVPVFLYDSKRKAIAVSHSGWRGTVAEIARQTVMEMSRRYGSDPVHLTAAIGPSIGPCCFEVGGEVREEFARRLPWSEDYCKAGQDGKWFIDLWGIIENTLVSCGLQKNNITTAGLCTKCHTDMFFSHRGDRGKTGSMAAVMQLKEK